MTQSPTEPPSWWEPVQKFLDNKVVSWGIPGVFVAIAADRARNSEWEEFRILLAIAAVIWLLIALIKKLLPRLEKLFDWFLDRCEAQILRWWWDVTSNFKGQYYKSLIDYHQDYRTKGLKTQGDFVLSLEKVFVPLKVAPESVGQVSSGMLLPRGTGNRLDIWDFLANIKQEPAYGRLAIIGPPGSGKTTLLQYITLIYAHNRQRKQHRNAPPLIPILIYLRDVRDRITSDKPPNLAELINQQLAEKEELEARPAWFKTRLKQGKCLVMLDGLDEVADETQRKQVSQWVDAQMRAYPTPIVVTSRPFGYRSAPVERVRTTLEAQPFTFDDMRQFVGNWYLQNEVMSRLGRDSPAVRKEAEEKAADLIRRISNNAPLSAMVVNPLLLTMVATVHRFRGALPGSRLELYAEICDVLLGRRADAKGLTTALTVNQQKAVLQVLALGLMEAKTREFDQQLGVQLIQNKLATVVGQGTDAAVFLKQVENLSGLLVERERGQYEFAHKSIQEYLAATEIKETRRVALLINSLEDPWWDETIRLYAAQSDATILIQAALERKSVPVLSLAYDCVEEGATVELAVRKQLQEVLDTGLESNDPKQFHLAVDVKLDRRLKQFIRIDDNTQIDRTYITWSEYRKYIHDIGGNVNNSALQVMSNNYDVHHPITGLNGTEACLFCDYLRQYKLTFRPSNGDVACYRLPTDEELSQYPIGSDLNLSRTGIRLVRVWMNPTYAQLSSYLSVGLWREADEETARLMLKIANREKAGYLDVESIRQFPCAALSTIDQLWIEFSQGKFGFSIQKNLWLSLGGQLEREASSWMRVVIDRLPNSLLSFLLGWAYVVFCNANGWRKQGDFISLPDVMYTNDAPRGHLPFGSEHFFRGHRAYIFWNLFSRIAHCKL